MASNVKWHYTYAQANKNLGGYFKVTQMSLTVPMLFLIIFMARMKTLFAQASHADTDTFMQVYLYMS